MQTLFKIFGFIITFGGLFILKSDLEEVRILEKGHLVAVELKDCSFSRRYGVYIKFEYNGKRYVERIFGVKGLNCEKLEKLYKLVLITNDEYKRFIYPEYNPYKNLAYGILIEILGICLLYVGFRNKCWNY